MGARKRLREEGDGGKIERASIRLGKEKLEKGGKKRKRRGGFSCRKLRHCGPVTELWGRQPLRSERRWGEKKLFDSGCWDGEGGVGEVALELHEMGCGLEGQIRGGRGWVKKFSCGTGGRLGFQSGFRIRAH